MNGLIIFDEADALFGKRTKIKEAHDRYANMETSYLLKRLQDYKEITFISSNSKNLTAKDYAKIDYMICLPIKKPEWNS